MTISNTSHLRARQALVLYTGANCASHQLCELGETEAQGAHLTCPSPKTKPVSEPGIAPRPLSMPVVKLLTQVAFWQSDPLLHSPVGNPLGLMSPLPCRGRRENSKQCLHVWSSALTDALQGILGNASSHFHVRQPAEDSSERKRLAEGTSLRWQAQAPSRLHAAVPPGLGKTCCQRHPLVNDLSQALEQHRAFFPPLRSLIRDQQFQELSTSASAQ